MPLVRVELFERRLTPELESKLIVLTTLLHARETAEVERGAPAVELALVDLTVEV